MPGRMLVEEYVSLMTRTGAIFQKRQRMRVKFLECVVEVMVWLLLTHRQIQRGMVQGAGGRGGTSPPLLLGRPRFTRPLLRNICCGYGSRYRGDWVGVKTRPTSGFTLRTAMCRTQ